MRKGYGDDYGLHKGQQLPPPGRENIIVRTPNPLPTPTSVGGTPPAAPSPKGQRAPGQREPVRSDAHAVQTLGDAPFVAYALIQAFKLFSALVAKRWPELR